MERFLTPQERDELKAQHRLEQDKRICDRIKAMLLSDKGWSYQEIAEALLLSEDAVKRHIEEYLQLARRSATECAGILDICQRLKLVATNRHERGREHLLRIVAMLTRMVKGKSVA